MAPLKTLLERVTSQNTKPPATVVRLPAADLNQIYQDIWRLTNDLVTAQSARGSIDLELQQVSAEFAERLGRNQQDQDAIKERLVTRQKQMIVALGDCGIRASLPEERPS